MINFMSLKRILLVSERKYLAISCFDFWKLTHRGGVIAGVL